MPDQVRAQAKPERFSSADQREILDTLMVLTAMTLNVNLPPSVVARARQVLEAYAARVSAAAAAGDDR